VERDFPALCISVFSISQLKSSSTGTLTEETAAGLVRQYILKKITLQNYVTMILNFSNQISNLVLK
jgi:hypothetical protein